MLSQEENDLVCRVGPGTLMGDFMRQYWLPTTINSSMLSSPDCPPLRLRILGEDLIAFRVTSGQVGIVVNACPHRGASIFFGRNEEEGLRCVYHGWKFDTAGACVDMPSEPAESNFKNKVRIKAYPAQEVNGMVWVYMGPRAVPPPMPALECNTAAPEMCYEPQMFFYDCNWLQALEGDIDSAHIDYLHSRLTEAEIRGEPGGGGRWGFSSPSYEAPHLLIHRTDYGAVYAGVRKWDDETLHYRLTQFCMPIYDMIPDNGPTVGLQVTVPLDDDHTAQIRFLTRLRGEVPPEGHQIRDPYTRMGGYLPATSDPLSRWRSSANRDNDYMLDYDVQRTQLFCGIPRDGKLQDVGIVESMGNIYTRNAEHLGTSDMMIIAVRRMLLSAAKALREKGTVHPTIDHPELYRVRPVEILVKDGTDWLEATEELRSSDSGKRMANFVTAELL